MIKMKKEIKIISKKKQTKLINSFPKYIESNRKAIEKEYGVSRFQEIKLEAKRVYPEIVQVLPTFSSFMYDHLMVVASRLAALKKGMRSADIDTGEFVKFNIEQIRLSTHKIPRFIRILIGKIYLSKLMRRYLNSIAKKVTRNGWPTRLISGKKQDDFAMSIETSNCQMVAFFESIGEGDIRPYCTFFDFTSAEALGIGLKQISDIDSGVCKYCFYKQGTVKWPGSIEKILKE